MATAVRLAARAVARVVRPAVHRWRAYWDVDHVAARFHTPQQYVQAAEAVQARRAQAMRKLLRQHVEADMLPRMLDEHAPVAGASAGAGRVGGSAAGDGAAPLPPSATAPERIASSMARVKDQVSERMARAAQLQREV
jgi:hypothetical protein